MWRFWRLRIDPSSQQQSRFLFSQTCNGVVEIRLTWTTRVATRVDASCRGSGGVFNWPTRKRRSMVGQDSGPTPLQPAGSPPFPIKHSRTFSCVPGKSTSTSGGTVHRIPRWRQHYRMRLLEDPCSQSSPDKKPDDA
jgi:hypothetical protein